MTSQTIFKRLTDIDSQIQTMLREIGIGDDDELWDIVAPNKADPDDMFLFYELNDLIQPLYTLHHKLMYLLTPCSGVRLLKKYPNGRYGYDVQPFEDSRTFTCGSPLEALICDE